MLYATPFITIYCLFVAAFAGEANASFMNCTAWRIVHGECFWKGRSHCDHCGHELGFIDLIPVVGYLIRGGRCHYCGEKLSPRHLVYECIGAALFILLLLRFDLTLDTLEYCLLCTLLMGVSFADLEGYIIPDGFLIAGVGVRAVFLLADGIMNGNLLSTLGDALLGGLAVPLALLVTVLVFEKITGKEAMGGGDLKLLAMLGLFLGWKKNLLCLLIACFVGILTAVITQKVQAAAEAKKPKQKKKSGKNEEYDPAEDPKAFPWGPGLAIAAFVTLMFGDGILNAYLSLF